MNKLVILLSIPLLLSCGGEETDTVTGDETATGDYVISGTLENGAGQTIKIEQIETDHFIQVGSGTVAEDGSFSIYMEDPVNDFYRISLKENDFIWLILDKGEQPVINADANDLAMSYTVTGSEDSEILKELFLETDAYNLQMEQITGELSRLAYGDTTARAEILMRADSIKGVFRNYLLTFIEEHPTSPACISTFEYFQNMEDVDVVRLIRDNLKPTFSHSQYYTMLESHIFNMDRQIAQLYVPDIQLPNPQGETIALSSLRGKTVLIDFWASWCKPCRAANPEVVELYNKYKDKGFTVYSVSLDGHPQDPDPKGSWMAAIEQDGLIWPNHVSDLQYWNSQVVTTFGFQGIPHTVLVDPEGMVIESGLRGPALAAKLEELFGA